MKLANLYESPVLRAASGPVLRPGGLDLTRRALAFCALSPTKPVLDVGCGEGASTALLVDEMGVPAIGIDFSAELLSSARRQNPHLPLLRGKVEAIPIREETIQGIICECVLSLLPDPLTALKEFYHLIRPKGFLVLTDIFSRTDQTDSFLKSLPFNTCLKGAMGRTQIKKWVKGAGFKVMIWEDHSDSLKQWTARMIFAFGSLEAFWKAFIHPLDLSGLQCALKNTQPGYYLLIARKES